jgi:hypothetical protein
VTDEDARLRAVCLRAVEAQLDDSPVRSRSHFEVAAAPPHGAVPSCGLVRGAIKPPLVASNTAGTLAAPPVASAVDTESGPGTSDAMLDNDVNRAGLRIAYGGYESDRLRLPKHQVSWTTPGTSSVRPRVQNTRNSGLRSVQVP